VTARRRPVRVGRPELVAALLGLTMTLLATGCGPRLGLVGLTEARWRVEVRRHGVDPATVVDPLAVTDEMRRAAEQAVGEGRTIERLHQLQQFLFGDEFAYEPRGTYTAIEAFRRGRGNCVSFTVLFIAMSRSLGIPMRAALLRPVLKTEQAGDLIIVNNHLVAVYENWSDPRVFDFYLRQQWATTDLQFVDDLWLTAIYTNNLGAAELIAGNAAGAVADLEAAIRLAPRFLAPYGNLGLARRQLGDERGALAIYEAALKIDPGYSPILNNLAALYATTGRDREARDVLAGSNSGRAPYLLLLKGVFAARDGRPARALRYYRRAARDGPRLPEPLVAIARIQLELGRRDEARRALARALALAPDHPEALRLQRRLEATAVDRVP